jgi:tetrahydromethanopterin S-methyltransferase subunit B
MIKVEGHQNLYRDPNTGAIVNTDRRAYLEYVRQRNLLTKQKEEKRNLEQEVSSLYEEVAELKKLVHDLLGR